MANPRKPFRLNVGFIVHEEIGYRHRFPLEYKNAVLGDDLTLENLNSMIVIDRTQQGLVVQGEFSGDTTLECVRCLKEFRHTLHGEWTELYAFSQKSMSESGLLMPDDGHIDFAPVLREYALLEVPIKALCKPDCKGLCIECGQDLNVKDCGHSQDEDDSPFSILKDKLK
jgi:uncharacterized protein